MRLWHGACSASSLDYSGLPMSTGEKTCDLVGERRAGLWQLGDEIAVLLALEGEQAGEFISCVGM